MPCSTTGRSLCLENSCLLVWFWNKYLLPLLELGGLFFELDCDKCVGVRIQNHTQSGINVSMREEIKVPVFWSNRLGVLRGTLPTASYWLKATIYASSSPPSVVEFCSNQVPGTSHLLTNHFPASSASPSSQIFNNLYVRSLCICEPWSSQLTLSLPLLLCTLPSIAH